MQVTYNSTHNGYSINNKQGQGCYVEILDKLDAHTQDMIQNHSQVLTLRFDLRTKSDSDEHLDSKKLDHFRENITADLTRNNPLPEEGMRRAKHKNQSKHKVDPRLIVVLEQHGVKKPHAHCFLLVNGNAKKEPWDILQRVERQYANTLKEEYELGLVDYCDKKGPNSYMIKSNDIENLHEMQNVVSYHRSYLAKTRGKDKRVKGSWLVRGTRLPKKDSD